MEDSVQEARKKLADKFANTQIGGKGTLSIPFLPLHIYLILFVHRYSKKKEEAC